MRRRVSANFENASRIGAFRSVRVFGHDGAEFWHRTEWWPFLIFHRGGLRIKVINNKRLIAESCRKQDIEPDQLTLHADRGSSMRSKPVGLLLADLGVALLHGPEQIADLPVPVAESPGAVRIGHPERSHLVEYLAPNSVFNSLPRQRSSPHLRPDDRLVTIDRVLHHASLGVA